MKWIKHRLANTRYPTWVLEDYPFFQSSFIQEGPGIYCTNIHFNYRRYRDVTLGEMKEIMVNLLMNCFETLNLENINDFNTLSRCRGISLSYTDWCGNTGGGHYIDKQRWKSYHWVNGRFLESYSTSNNYAIRYDIYTSVIDVKSHATGVVKRQINRFLLRK